MKYLVTRHPGALQWLSQVIAEPSMHITHLSDLNLIQAGDIVVGTLPINLVAALNKRGARYFHLHIDMPEYLRGHELSKTQLEQLDASLVEYSAVAKPSVVA